MKLNKLLAITNILGFTILFVLLYASISSDPFPWDVFLLIANIHLSLPFLIFGFITLKNVHQPNVKAIKIGFLLCFLFIWLPSLMFLFFSFIIGAFFSLTLLAIGLVGFFYLKDPSKKMMLFNLLGILALLFDALGVIGVLIANQ